MSYQTKYSEYTESPYSIKVEIYIFLALLLIFFFFELNIYFINNL